MQNHNTINIPNIIAGVLLAMPLLLGSVPSLKFDLSLTTIFVFVASLLVGKPLSTDFNDSGSLLSVTRKI